MPPPPNVELSGVLSRCVFGDDRAELRLSPFAVSLEEAQPVWSLVFDEPGFDAADVEPYLDSEVDIEVFDYKVVLNNIWQQTQQVLSAGTLSVERVSYDTTDLELYVRTLLAENERLNSNLRAATAKDNQGRSLLRELLRRAEIKAAASDHLRERQAAAIEVLKRLQAHFDE